MGWPQAAPGPLTTRGLFLRARTAAYLDNASSHPLGVHAPAALHRAQESLCYIPDFGVDNIRGHARSLTDRLHDELPKLGYSGITPRHKDSPMVSFIAPDPTAAMDKLRAAGVHVAMRFGNKMRIFPSVYINQDDVSRLLEALT